MWIVRLFLTKAVGYLSKKVRIVCEIMLNLYAVISNSSETKEILGESWKSKKFLRSLMLNDNIVNKWSVDDQPETTWNCIKFV